MGGLRVQETIIVRNKIYRKGELVSKLIMLTADNHFNSVQAFMEHYGESLVMSELFDENIEQENISSSKLYNMYQNILITGNNNEYFMKIYKINEDLGLLISEHIYIFHISKDLTINGERILPWECVDNKKYIADTWWETDKTILNDLITLSYVDFMIKYKAI